MVHLLSASCPKYVHLNGDLSHSANSFIRSLPYGKKLVLNCGQKDTHLVSVPSIEQFASPEYISLICSLTKSVIDPKHSLSNNTQETTLSLALMPASHSS